jgi:hypothetical protein
MTPVPACCCAPSALQLRQAQQWQQALRDFAQARPQTPQQPHTLTQGHSASPSSSDAHALVDSVDPTSLQVFHAGARVRQRLQALQAAWRAAEPPPAASALSQALSSPQQLLNTLDAAIVEYGKALQALQRQVDVLHALLKHEQPTATGAGGAASDGGSLTSGPSLSPSSSSSSTPSSSDAAAAQRDEFAAVWRLRRAVLQSCKRDKLVSRWDMLRSLKVGGVTAGSSNEGSSGSSSGSSGSSGPGSSSGSTISATGTNSGSGSRRRSRRSSQQQQECMAQAQPAQGASQSQAVPALTATAGGLSEGLAGARHHHGQPRPPPPPPQQQLQHLLAIALQGIKGGKSGKRTASKPALIKVCVRGGVLCERMPVARCGCECSAHWAAWRPVHLLRCLLLLLLLLPPADDHAL